MDNGDTSRPEEGLRILEEALKINDAYYDPTPELADILADHIRRAYRCLNGYDNRAPGDPDNSKPARFMCVEEATATAHEALTKQLKTRPF